MYYVTTTVVTVGYGDLHANTTLERIVTILIMFVGAFVYSYIVGSLSSIILSMDASARALDHKLNTLIEIKQKYMLDTILFNKIKRALKYGHTRQEDDTTQFLNELPSTLRTKLSVIMHKELLKDIEFFKVRRVLAELIV